MAAPVEVKLRNAESSLLFMQQEHAKTLQALHQELHKLQKKCAELNFELAMKSDDAEDDKYQSEIDELTKRLKSKERECDELREERDASNKIAMHFENQMKVRDKVFQDELSKQGQKLMVLTAELDQRSGTIAYLTTQLHQMSLKQRKPSIGSTGRPESERVTSPAPPKEPAPARMRRFNLRTGNGHTRALHHTPRVASEGTAPEPSQVQSHMFTTYRGASSHSAKHPLRIRNGESARDLGVTAFIAHVDPAGKEVEVKPAPPILPPIHPHDARKEYSHSAEIETLAIEKPYTTESTLRSPNHSPVHTD